MTDEDASEQLAGVLIGMPPLFNPLHAKPVHGNLVLALALISRTNHGG